MPIPQIFVGIAAYRDTECQWTVRDLFKKAQDPDRIQVGLCWQFVPGEDDDCFLVKTRPSQCRVIEVDAHDSQGVCWARSQVQSLWDGEDYVLQIDSHMRFAQDWDRRLLEMLDRCRSDKPALTTYPSPYVPPNHFDPDVVSVMFANSFDSHGVLKLHSRGISPKDAPGAPQPNPFVAAGFLFSDSRLLREVPYDPHLYFQGEEITLAARLWTHGWDIFSPNEVLIYHDYSQRPGRRRHWEDHAAWTRLNDLSYQRIRHLLGGESCADAEALRELDRYGLGQARSLEAYQAFSGVDFRRRTIDGKAAQEGRDPVDAADRRRVHGQVFGSIWRGNGWACEETRSGPGSTLAATAAIRRQLTQVFDLLGIHSLTDAGCGDCHWIGEISGGLDLYFGLDVVDDLVGQSRRALGARRGHFFSTADITVDPLPRADAILCRDVLTHLTEGSVREALARFRESGSKYLIATTHARGINDVIHTGGWQAIDLAAAPYRLPPPRLLLSEELANSSKALGVWPLTE